MAAVASGLCVPVSGHDGLGRPMVGGSINHGDSWSVGGNIVVCQCVGVPLNSATALEAS